MLLVTTRGDFSTLNRLKKNLRALPISIAHDVAKRTAPAVTSLATTAFTSGRTVYDEARPRGVDGRPLTLHETGQTKETVRFVANGRIVRAVLAGKDKYGRKYQHFLVGLYRVLPMGRIPAHWQKRIRDLVAESGVEL